LSKGPLDANALYSVWGGANDIIYHVGLAGAGAESAAQVQAAVTRAATDELAQIARLHNGGARYIVVFNMPDIGRTPAGTATPAAPFSDLSSLYNLTLSVGLDSLGFDVIPVNAFALLNEVIANPATYGFSNATIPACTVASSLTCTPSTLREPNAGTTYVFADALHPTTAAHALLAQYVESIIEAPEKVALLAEVPLQLAGSQRRAIESRYISSPGPRAKGKIDVYAAYDYNPSTLDRTAVSPGNDNTGHTLTVGGDTRISDALSAGLAFGYSWNKSDLDNNAGGFDLDAAMLTAYAAYSVSSAYIAGLATVGDLDYKDVRRNINLGPAVRTESGNAKGSLQSYTLTGGYLFNTGSLRHGPVATVTYQKVLVNDFAESGTSSTAMRFGEQKREALVSSLGWQLTGVMPAA
jgi:outer membrane lipase/esterase